MKLIKQRKACKHCYPTISLITFITKCLPLGICTNRVKLSTLMKYMFPQRGSDLLLTERAGSWCLFYLSTVTYIKKLHKKSTTFGNPFVSQLGHGCSRTCLLCVVPTFYYTIDEFPSYKIVKKGFIILGGAKYVAWYMQFTI